jgi:hypothetical protein
MDTGKRRLLMGGAMIALALAGVLVGGGNRPAARAAEGDARVHLRPACQGRRADL